MSKHEESKLRLQEYLTKAQELVGEKVELTQEGFSYLNYLYIFSY